MESNGVSKRSEDPGTIVGDKEVDNGNGANNDDFATATRSLPPAHWKNPEISPILRYGVPIFILATLGLLLASDIGSGVAAYRLLETNDPLIPNSQALLLKASVFTSISALWRTGSYALVFLIVIASISWPFVKLLLSLFAWLVPFRSPQRRERLLAIMDALGKWSFVDMVVFSEIVVVFRATIPLGGPVLQVYIVPLWGIFGFLTATMLSLIATQLILHQHRNIIYRPVDPDDRSKSSLHSLSRSSSLKSLAISFLLLSGFVLYLCGCLVFVFRVRNSRAGVDQEPIDYSIVSTGLHLPDSALNNDVGKYIWLQILWFFLGMAVPLLSNVLFGLLLWLPASKVVLERLLLAAEISFAWSSAEVFFLSTIFAVAEIPTFGNGLIDSGCDICFVVTSQLLPALAIFALGTALSIAGVSWLFRLAHSTLYSGRELYETHETRCSCCWSSNAEAIADRA